MDNKTIRILDECRNQYSKLCDLQNEIEILLQLYNGFVLDDEPHKQRINLAFKEMHKEVHEATLRLKKVIDDEIKQL